MVATLFFLSILVVSGKVLATKQIEVAPYTQINQQVQGRLTLGEVVRFHNIDQGLKNELSRVVLSDRPELGERRVFTSRALSEVFRGNKKIFSKYGAKNVQLMIPRKVIVENTYKLISRTTLTAHIIKAWKGACKECKFDVTHISVPVIPAGLAVGAWSIRVPRDLPKGSFSYPLYIERNKGQDPHIFWVSGQAAVYKRVPVTTRAIAIGERLQKTDVSFEFKDISFAHDSTPKLAQMIGQKARRGMRAKDVIYHGSIEREKALRRGDIVKMVTGTGEFEISTTGISQQDGYAGDMVKIKNPVTKKLVTGRIVGKGKVEIQ